MTILNLSKPITSLTNTSKVSIGETWDSILTTWDSEVRTWDAISSLFTNTSKPTTSITNSSKPS